MDRAMMAGAPPPRIPRLTPEQEAQLAAGQPVVFEDGSQINPDGSSIPAGDSPNDFSGQGTGYGDVPPVMAGAPSPAVGGAGDGDGLMIAEDPSEMRNPLAGPLHRNYRQTANAGFPGAEGGIGGPPVGGNPLMAEAPPPAVEAPINLVVPGGAAIRAGNPQASRVDNGASMRRVGPSTGGEAEPGRTVNYGRRVMTRRPLRTTEQPNNGIFNVGPRDGYRGRR